MTDAFAFAECHRGSTLRDIGTLKVEVGEGEGEREGEREGGREGGWGVRKVSSFISIKRHLEHREFSHIADNSHFG